MRLLQSASNFKLSEFAILTAIFLLNTTSVPPVLADGEAAETGMETTAAVGSESPTTDTPMVVAPAPGESGGTVSDPISATASSPAKAQSPVSAPTETPTLAPAQSPTLAPEQPASATPSTPSTDLVGQTPQMAINPVLASAYSNRLGKMEEIAFGASYAEHEMIDRIDHLEEEIFKSKSIGAPDVRISKLEAKVFGQSAFNGGSQAPKGAGYMPFAPGSSNAPPVASVGGAGVSAPPYTGGNAPPVIIPGKPSAQSSSPPPLNQLPPVQQPYQAPVPPSAPAYNNAPTGSAPPYSVQPYQAPAPYSGNNYYPNNQGYNSQRPPANAGYGYSYPYGNQNYQPYSSTYPSTYPPAQSNPYQYGGSPQPYSGQNYQQYQPYRPGPIQQPSIPQQLYTQPYQQYPSSQYPPTQYPPQQYPPNTQTQTPPEVTPSPVQMPSSKNSAACDKVANAIPQSAKDGDYFANIRHFAGGTCMHWQSFPVLVHLPKDSPESWRRAFEGDLKKWSQYVPMSVAKGDEKARIDVQWVNKLPAKILGVTRIEGSADDLKVTVYVLRPTFYPSEIPENILQHVFAHELGHALGLLGHSTNSADVMYIHDDKPDKSGKVDATSTSEKGKPQFSGDKPSARDLNTLKKLYTSAPLPSGFKLEQPLEYSTNTAHI